jgi:hypothetical protein
MANKRNTVSQAKPENMPGRVAAAAAGALPPVVSIDEAEAEPNTDDVPTNVAPVVDVPEISVKKTGDDLVVIVVTKEIEPPPIIGHYRMGYELGVTKLIPQHPYKVPRRVAEVMVDAKKAIIVS